MINFQLNCTSKGISIFNATRTWDGLRDLIKEIPHIDFAKLTLITSLLTRTQLSHRDPYFYQRNPFNTPKDRRQWTVIFTGLNRSHFETGTR